MTKIFNSLVSTLLYSKFDFLTFNQIFSVIIVLWFFWSSIEVELVNYHEEGSEIEEYAHMEDSPKFVYKTADLEVEFTISGVLFNRL